MLTAGFMNNVSLSTIVLNSGDCDKEYMDSLVWETVLQQHFLQVLVMYLYWYKLLALFIHPECALDLKLSNFKIF